MPIATINGLSLAYELIGESGQPWVITPGGRFTKESPGVRQLAEILAAEGNRVLIWDRPNCGESDVCFEGSSESAMQADALAGLLTHLDLTPAIIAGGSGGARVSLLTVARHPEDGGRPRHLVDQRRRLRPVVAGDALLRWLRGRRLDARHGGSGGPAGVGRGAGAEPVQPGPVPGAGPVRFIATMERWMQAYCPRDDEPVPGLPEADARALDIPALVFRSGASDPHHTRATSEALAGILPDARLVEPPWGDREWIERGEAREEGLFARWTLLAPQLLEWKADVLG